MNRQWKFVIVDAEGESEGTDDPKVAREHAVNGMTVVHMASCTTLEVTENDVLENNIPEQTLYSF